MEKLRPAIAADHAKQGAPVPASIGGFDDEEVFALSFVNIENTCRLDVTGHPAMSVPCGLRVDSAGMMLVAKHFDENAIYRGSDVFERSEKWQWM